MRNVYKSVLVALSLVLLFAAFKPQASKQVRSKFITIAGPNLIAPDGEKFLIRGINLGNWLNPEGYMFGFKGANCFRLIDKAFREMVGPDFTDEFWKNFKDNYITREDIRFIKSTGVNSIRVPFHYKLFTDEDYMGLSAKQDGFQRIDSLLSWCRESKIYMILDMHDAPGGQTGDNIDDSYGYPWLMTSEKSQETFAAVWKKIASHYKDEPFILGYDLLNEPIAPYFGEDMAKLNAALEPVYKKAVKAIREVDNNHIVLLGGAQWDGNFKVFKDSKFDSKMMYTCHRYWCDTLQHNIQDFVHFRDSVNLPIYMGETGENTDQWISAWTRLMVKNNIGYHYWPYKKMGKSSCMVTVPTPENWDKIVAFTESPRNTFTEIRKARLDQETAKKILLDYLEGCKFSKCAENKGYIKAMGVGK
ncbi:MAG: glycoside hydrolase family 5 protein [Bacteroidetes bacterium]|nr:glycoside hydrolase family 5 protein [Bacteroidota bacterium]